NWTTSQCLTILLICVFWISTNVSMSSSVKLMLLFVQMVCCIPSCIEMERIGLIRGEDLFENVTSEIFEAWNPIKFVSSEQFLQAIAIATLWLESNEKIRSLNKC
ncbi:hypothetical protein BC830DRAFT_1116142, partial [Chytriomyces sp. MP71]